MKSKSILEECGINTDYCPQNNCFKITLTEGSVVLMTNTGTPMIWIRWMKLANKKNTVHDLVVNSSLNKTFIWRISSCLSSKLSILLYIFYKAFLLKKINKINKQMIRSNEMSTKVSRKCLRLDFIAAQMYGRYGLRLPYHLRFSIILFNSSFHSIDFHTEET